MSVDVTNTGARTGTDVVQLYSSARQSRVQQPVKQLRDFSKVTLAPKQTRTVRFEVPVSDLAFWDVTRGKSVVESGVYDFSVGRNATDVAGSQPVYVAGERIPARDLTRPTPAENFDAYQGTTLTDTAKTAGTSVAATAGSWLAFKDVALNGPAKFTASVSKAEAGPTRLTVRLDSPGGRVLGTVAVPSTGDHYAYQAVTAALAKASGRHDVYLTFDGPVNLATFSLR